MHLSQESYRTRWIALVCAWTLTAVALFYQARIVREYLDIVGALGVRPAPVSTPLVQAYPAFAADAQVWVRHALSLLEGDQVRLRYTTIDNAPMGREVHWNSAWAWCIAGAGKLHHLFTGQPLTASVEKATIWLNPLALLTLIVILSAWATRRAGLIAGLVVNAAMLCHDRIYEGFFPSYVDHHGLLTVAVFGTVLGAIFMGGGWWQPRVTGRMPLLPESAQRARSAAVFSALSGACGLWVSAASVIPPIAIVGVSGLLAGLIQGRTALKQGVTFDAYAWRLWGRVGGALSLFFYLLEYFPNHLSLHLEPNHPFHALAWFGAGEMIAEVLQRWLGAPARRFDQPVRLLWPLALIAIGPIAMKLGGARVLAFTDPFMLHLHNDYIQEFLPMWRTLRNFDSRGAFQIIGIGSLPFVLGVATLSYRRRESPIVLFMATIAAFFFLAMSWMQSRWLLNATGIHVALSMLLVATWTASTRLSFRWAAFVALICVLYLPSLYSRIKGSRADVAALRVAPKDAMAAMNRDIAAALRASQPEGNIILLSSPNASTGIGYYGRFATLGTLYWENTAGLKAAAGIFGASSENEAAQLIRERGVTHIAIVSDENFIEQYYRLMHPNATNEEVRRCWGVTLLVDRTVPQWLQMIPYKLPEDLKTLKSVVMLFKVNFNQTLPEAIYNVALAQISQDALDEAEKNLNLLLAQVPQAYQPYMRKGEILLTRRDFGPAVELLAKGISLAPANEHAALYIGTAGTLYNLQQHAAAIKLYRQALAEQFNPEIAIYLAWVLATSNFDDIRNGKEAMELAQAALQVDPNSPTYLNGLAAAHAELGNFAEAVKIVERALVSARLRHQDNVARDSEERLALYRSGKPLRK